MCLSRVAFDRYARLIPVDAFKARFQLCHFSIDDIDRFHTELLGRQFGVYCQLGFSLNLISYSA